MKLTIIINGRGGCGKDTFCDCIRARSGEGAVRAYSSIDAIKYVALSGGWDGEKDEAGRLLLSELKEAFVKYNDLPFEDTKKRWRAFEADEKAETMFLHIREMSEIEKMASWIRGQGGKVCTLLIRRMTPGWTGATGNPADDGAEAGLYDFVYENRFERGRGMEEDMWAFYGRLRAWEEEEAAAEAGEADPFRPAVRPRGCVVKEWY